MNKTPHIIPRLIRLRDASFYLGMDINRFNKEVRPHICEIRIGIQGIAFDRLDLDEFAEQYKRRNGRPTQTGISKWDAKNHQDFANEKMERGKLINNTSEQKFAKALAQIASKKQKKY